jgi:hypothetical protein
VCLAYNASITLLEKAQSSGAVALALQLINSILPLVQVEGPSTDTNQCVGTEALTAAQMRDRLQKSFLDYITAITSQTYVSPATSQQLSSALLLLLDTVQAPSTNTSSLSPAEVLAEVQRSETLAASLLNIIDSIVQKLATLPSIREQVKKETKI